MRIRARKPLRLKLDQKFEAARIAALRFGAISNFRNSPEHLYVSDMRSAARVGHIDRHQFQQTYG